MFILVAKAKRNDSFLPCSFACVSLTLTLALSFSVFTVCSIWSNVPFQKPIYMWCTYTYMIQFRIFDIEK